jgi:hypothetical protein
MADDDLTFRIAAEASSMLEVLGRIEQLLITQGQNWDRLAAAAESAAERVTSGTQATTTEMAKAVAIGEVLGDTFKKAMELAYEGVKHVVEFLPDLVKETADVGDKFWTMSAQTGVSAQALSQFDFVATQAGTSIESISSAIFLMGRNLDAGTRQSRDAIHALGLSFDELKHMAPEDAFQTIIHSLGELPSSSERARVGMEIFGRQFRSIAQLTTQDMQEMMNQADRMGLTVTKAQADMANAFTDAEDLMRRTWQGLTQQIGFALMPAMTQAITGVAELIGHFSQSLNIDFASWGEIATTAVTRMLAAFGQLETALEPLGKIMADALAKGIELLPDVLSALASILTSVTPLIQGFADIITALGPSGSLLAAGLLILAVNFGAVSGAMALLSSAGSVLLVKLGEMIVAMSGGIIPMLGEWIAGMTGAIAGALGLGAAEETAAVGAAVLEAALGGVLLIITALVAAWNFFPWQKIADGWTYLTTLIHTHSTEAASAAVEAQHTANAMAAAQKQVNDEWEKGSARVQELTNKAMAYSDAGHLTTAQMQAMASEAKRLQDSGQTLTPVLQAIVDAVVAMSNAEKQTSDQTKNTAADLQKIADLQLQSTKISLEMAKTGVDQRLALHDVEAAATLQKMKDQGAKEDVLNAEKNLLAMQRMKILFDAQKATNDAIAAINEQEYEADIQREQRGMTAQIALITARADAAISKKQEEGAALEVLAEMEEKKQEDIYNLQAAALQKAQDKMRDVVFEGLQAQIEITQDGLSKQLALIDLNSQKQIEAQQRAFGEDYANYTAYYVEVANIITAAEQRKNKARVDADKAGQDALLAQEDNYQKQLIDMTEVGAQRLIDLEQLRYDAEVRKYLENHRQLTEQDQQYLDGIARQHDLNNQKILDQERGFTDDLLVNLRDRGIKTRSELERNVDAEKEVLQEMLDAYKAGDEEITASMIEAQRARVAAATVAANEQIQQFERITGAVSGLLSAFSELGKLDGVSEGFKIVAETAGGVAKALDAVNAATKVTAEAIASGAFSAQNLSSVAAGWIGVAVAIYNVASALMKAHDAAEAAANLRVEGHALAESFDSATQFSNKLRDSIHQTTEALVDIGIPMHDAWLSADDLARAMHLTEIIQELGGVAHLTGQQVIDVAAEMETLFRAASEGGATGRAAVEELDKTLMQFADAAKQQGGLVDSMFLMMAQHAKETGVELEAVTKFMTDQAASAADALTRFATVGADAIQKRADLEHQLTTARGDDIDKITKQIEEQDRIIQVSGIHSQASADALGAALSASFAKMEEGGMSALDALKKLGPAIDALQAEFDAAGYSGGAAFDQIKADAALASDAVAGPALQSVAALNDVLKGLHNSGTLTQDMFSGLGAQVKDTFDALVAQGVNGDQAMRLMHPTLQTLWEMEQKFHLSLDDSTQAMIDQGVKSGQVGEQYMSAQDRMALSTERVLTVLEAIAERLGVTLPAGIRDAQLAMEGSADAMGGKFQTVSASAQLAIGSVKSAAEGLGRTMDTDVPKSAEQMTTSTDASWARMKGTADDYRTFLDTKLAAETLATRVPDAAATMQQKTNTSLTDMEKKALDLKIYLDEQLAADSMTRKVPTAADTMQQKTSASLGTMQSATNDTKNKMLDLGRTMDTDVTNSANTMQQKTSGSLDTVNAKNTDVTAQVQLKWMQTMSAAATATDQAASVMVNKMAVVGGSIDGVQNKLANTDWAGWANKAVEAAAYAEDAVTAVAEGRSPSGIKQIIARLYEAQQAGYQFSSAFINVMNNALDAATRLSQATALPPGMQSTAGSNPGISSSGTADRLLSPDEIHNQVVAAYTAQFGVAPKDSQLQALASAAGYTQGTSATQSFVNNFLNSPAAIAALSPTQSAALPAAASPPINVTLTLDGKVVTQTVVNNVSMNKDGAYTAARAALGLPS